MPPTGWTSTMTRWVKLLLATALLLVAAACGEAVDDVADTTDADDSAEVQGVRTSGLEVASTDLGDILAIPDARSVYLFTSDEPGQSTCFDACAASWPPVLLDADVPAAGDGVDADLIGTTERPDGGVQLTYDGWPLYLWAGDQAAGDVAGQGVNDVWWVVAPDGSPIQQAGDGTDDGDGADDEDDEGGSYGY